MLRRDLIQNRPLLSARDARLMQRGAGCSRGIAFVHEPCLDVKAACQTPRKALAQVCHFMRCAIAMERQSNDQQNGLPFLDQCVDGGEALIVFFAMKGCQWMREFQGSVANGNANAFPAKIKCQYSTLNTGAVILLC